MVDTGICRDVTREFILSHPIRPQFRGSETQKQFPLFIEMVFNFLCQDYVSSNQMTTYNIVNCVSQGN